MASKRTQEYWNRYRLVASIPSLPLTANGKVDHRALSRLRPEQEKGLAAPTPRRRKNQTSTASEVWELAGAGERVEVLATGLASASGRLPHVICVHCEESWRHFRANLIELGVTLTGDPRRAEIALDRAFALI